MATRPFVINREIVVGEPDQVDEFNANILDDLKTVLTAIDMADYDEFPNTQANLYRIMAKYDAFPVFFDETYHERYGGSPR